MKIQYVAEDGKVFSSNEDDPYGTFAKFECEYYEQYELNINHELLREEDFNLYNPMDI